MLKNSLLKWQILWLLPLTLLLPQTPLYGAQTLKTSSKTSLLLGYLETISILQCSYKENGILTQKQSAPLIHRAEEQMRQLQLISPNATVSCTCTKCSLHETGTPTIHYSLFWNVVKNMVSLNLLSKLTSVMVLLVNYLKNISNKLNKQLM